MNDEQKLKVGYHFDGYKARATVFYEENGPYRLMAYLTDDDMLGLADSNIDSVLLKEIIRTLLMAIERMAEEKEQRQIR